MSSIPKPAVSLFIYRSLLWLLTPYLLWRFFREARRYQDSDYFQQRRGYGYPQFAQHPVWFHAASVGEVNALLPLMQLFHRQYPALPLLLTSNTASSGAIARKKLPKGVKHAYLPMDWSGAMQRFLAHYQPRLAVIMETELWPNLYRLCDEGDTPLVIINGRLSRKTLEAPAWLRQLYRECLHHTTQVLTRSEADREGFLKLGVSAERCQVTGNIKFAAVHEEKTSPIELGRDYLLAASSRDSEELLIVDAWQKSGQKELLVIAPRHPQRLDSILRELAPLGLNMAIRSRGEQPDEATQVYLADTFGELRSLMAGARLVFMGGSLVDKGGHNILEPAALGKAIITGPYMDNFSDETRMLLEGGGLRQVASVAELSEAFSTLMPDAQQREKLGQQARNTLTRNADIAERYLTALKPYLD